MHAVNSYKNDLFSRQNFALTISVYGGEKMTEATEEKTIGFTPFIYCSENPLFHVSAGVPVSEALSQVCDLLALAKALAEDAAFIRNTDRYAWAAHYLTAMGKAVIDDVVKAVTPRPNRPTLKTAK